MLSEPTFEESLPAAPSVTPVPTPSAAPEVRRAPVNRAQPVRFYAPAGPRSVPATSSNAASGATKTSPVKHATREVVVEAAAPTFTSETKTSSKSVLRKASAEQRPEEPRTLLMDYPRAKPIVRSQSPEGAEEVPANPLRR